MCVVPCSLSIVLFSENGVSRRFSFREGIGLNERSGFAVGRIPNWIEEQSLRFRVFDRSESPECLFLFFAKCLAKRISPASRWSDHQNRERVDGRLREMPSMAGNLREHGVALRLRCRDLMNSRRGAVFLQIEDFAVTACVQEKRGIGRTSEARRSSQELVETKSPLRQRFGGVHDIVLVEPFHNANR